MSMPFSVWSALRVVFILPLLAEAGFVFLGWPHGLLPMHSGQNDYEVDA